MEAASQSATSWGNPFIPQQAPKPTLTQALLNWDNAKKALEEAKELELETRKMAFEMGYGKDAKEGVNTIPLANGYELKGTKKLSYKLKAPEGFDGNTTDFVDRMEVRFRQISNEGEFIFERLFKFDVDISLTEYRKLCDEAKYEAPKKAMLAEVNKVLVITEATPTLEIKEPKGRKK